MHTPFIRALRIMSLAVVVGPTLALASATPQVTSFQATPSTINNNYITSLTWTIDSNNGADMLVACSPGITVQTDAQQNITCGTRFPAGTTASLAQGLKFTNVSGASKGVMITLYPHDSNGNNYDAGSMNTTVTVGTSPQPILSFSAASSSIVSGSPLTLTWSGTDAVSTNMQFSCVDGVKIYAALPASGGAPLPCGITAFSSDLPISGSTTVYPVSTSPFPPTIAVYLLPTIGSGMYDLTHSLTTSFTVAPQPAAPTVSVTRFSVTPNALGPSIPLTVRWEIANATSSNLEFDCPELVSISSVVGTTSTPIPCNTLAFADPLNETGTSTFMVTAKNAYNSQPITVLIIPRGTNGEFQRTLARSAQVYFDPRYTAPVASSIAAPVSPSAGTSAGSAPKSGHYTFTLPLKRGSRNADVTALQKYLATDVSLYPEAVISGYFGPATAAAVGRFQMKYKLSSVGDSAYGTVGPKTRAQLNSVQ